MNMELMMNQQKRIWSTLQINVLNRYQVPENDNEDNEENPQEELQGEDIISRLPNNVLIYIACFLPLESVKNLGLLSSRWRHIWKEKVTKFGPMSELPEVISEYYGPIRDCHSLTHAFLLEYYIDESRPIVTCLVNQRLSLDFRHADTVPPWVYDFRLSLVVIKGRPSSHCCLDFSYIRVLNLYHVNFFSKDALSPLASQCHHLEYLNVSEGSFNSLFINVPKLRGLSILDCPKLEHVFILAPELQSLWHKGKYPITYNIVYYEALACIKFDIRSGPRPGPASSCCRFLENLLYAPSVECLTLCQWDFHTNIRPRVNNWIRFYKLKEVWWIDSSMEQWKIESLISFLKLCPVLEKLFITVDPACYVDNRFQDMQCKVRANMPLNHLKLVKLEGLRSLEEEILLAARIYQEAMGGPVKVVSLRQDSVKAIVRVRSKKAGRNAKYEGIKKGLCSKYEYKYFEETDTETINWMHPHK